MASFGEGFANALNAQMGINQRRAAAAKQQKMEEQRLAQQQKKAQQQMAKETLARYGAETKNFITDIRSLREKGEFFEANRQINALRETFENFDLNAQNLANQGLVSNPPKYSSGVMSLLSQDPETARLNWLKKKAAEAKAAREPIAEDAARAYATTKATKLAEKEFAAPPRPDYLDEKGNVKGEDVSRIRQIVQSSLGKQDQFGNAILSPENAQKFPEIIADAINRLKTGKADDLGRAAADAIAAAEIKRPADMQTVGKQIINIAEGGLTDSTDAVGKLEKLKVQDATGVGSTLKDMFLNNFGANFFGDLADQDVVEARQQLGLLVSDFIAANKRSDKLPVWEQVRLSNIFQEPSFWRSPKQVVTQLASFDKSLTDSIDQRMLMLGIDMNRDDRLQTLRELSDLSRFRARVRRFNLTAQNTGLFDYMAEKSKDPKTPREWNWKDLPPSAPPRR